MKKGDVVLVNAYVTTRYAETGDEIAHAPEGDIYKESIKCLIKHRPPEPFKGLVVGYSFRATGYYCPSKPEYGEFGTILSYDPAILSEDKRHKVWMVQPFGDSDNRWYKPLACLEEDLTIV
jgi:hypothetical protein